jgi:hypothetical protein
MSSYTPPPPYNPQSSDTLRADLSGSVVAAGPPVPPPPPPAKSKPAPIWLQRFTLLVQVLFSVYLGIMLVILPWWPQLLDTNELISAYPRLHAWLSLGAVRGIISGIGLADIWIGVSEVIYYHEVRE